MQFRAGENVYTVIATDFIDSNDPADLGMIVKSKRLIQISRGQSFDSAFETLAHEFIHASEWHVTSFTVKDTEQRVQVVANAAISFLRQYIEQGGDAAFAALMEMEIDTESRPARTRAEVMLAEMVTESPQVRHAAVIRYVLCWNLSDAQFEEYRAKYEAANLNPLLGDCYARVVRKPDSRELSVELGSTVKALRRIADRTGRLAHPGNYEWCGTDNVWKELWIGEEPPYAARCQIKIKGEEKPVTGIAKWESFAQYIETREGVRVLAEFWQRMGDHMLGKCAEAAALSRAFVQCNGLYLAEELQYMSKRRRPVRPPVFRDFGEELAASRAEANGVAVDEPSVDLETERQPSGNRAMQDLHRMMRGMGVVQEPLRVAIIDQVKADNPMLEDENWDAFTKAIVAEIKRRQRGR